MLKIIGAKGNIKDVDKFLKQISIFAKDNKLIIQAFDANVIFGEKHLISAVEHAVRAIDRKTNTTNSLEMEILLYASGERQLKLAIPKIGVKKGEVNIALVFFNKTRRLLDILIEEFLEQLSLIRDDKVLDGNIETLKKFGLNENEIKTVTKAKYGDLILEKVAMVDVIK
jgi:KEOPS complex subunit Cgi121